MKERRNTITINKILLIDQDDTLGDFGGKVHSIAQDEYGFTIPPFHERDNFNLQDTIPGFTKEIMQDVFHIPNFYRDLAVLDGAVQALEEIREAGVNAFICTSPIYTNESCASDKVSWIREHFGDWWGNRVIITADKTIIQGRYLVDDKQKIHGTNPNPSWEQVVFDQPYNRHLVDHKRIMEWSTWDKVMPDIIP